MFAGMSACECRLPIADCRVRMQKPVVRAIFYDSKCYTFGLKKSAKKFENNLHVTKICRYFAPASMRGTPLWGARFLRKVFRENLEKRFGSCRKTAYFCARFDEVHASRTRKFLRRSDKKSWKKIWKLSKNLLPLHPLRWSSCFTDAKVLKAVRWWKIFQKDLEVWKTCLNFAPLSHSPEWDGDKDEIPNKIGI